MATPPDFTAGQVLTAAQMNKVGLWTRVPSSVTVSGGGSSASVGTDGLVTFASAATVSVNDAFSADYTNYRIVSDFDASTSIDVEVRLRVAGSDNSTSNAYVRQSLISTGGTVSSARTTTTFWIGLNGDSTATNGGAIEVYRPFAVDTTAYSAITVNSSSSAFLFWHVGTHNQNASYDGFSFITSTGTITGTLRIYGYNE